jgi:hypothetical protein
MSKINPVGLKGYEITERMKELMGIQPQTENKKTSVVELTKLGPDNKVYGIVRENHEYYIKIADNKPNLNVEDFQYIGGLKNKRDEVYPSYAKATKHLNFKFNSLYEAYGIKGNINIFENDNLVGEHVGFMSLTPEAMFKNEGNLDTHMKSECCGAQMMEGMCLECGMTMEEAKKYSSDAQEFIGKEIGHLMKDKGYKQNQAVAAAIAIARSKGYKVPKKLEEELIGNDASLSSHAGDDTVEDDVMLTPEMQAVHEIQNPKKEKQPKKGLSIEKALNEMDNIIDEFAPTNKKKVYSIR